MIVLKKSVSLVLSILMIMSAVFCIDLSAFAANASINAKEVSLYYLTDSCKEQIGNISSGYNKSFQLKVSGASSVSFTG